MRKVSIVRTTLSIDGSLLALAKHRARERGLTLGAYVEEAIQRDLAVVPATPAVVRLSVSKATGGPAPGVDLTSNRALYDAVGTDAG